MSKTYRIGWELAGIDMDKLSSTGYTTCPECSQDRKSHKNSKCLKVYPKTGYYKCNHCGLDKRVDSDEWLEKQHQDKFKNRITKPVPKATPIQMKPFSTTPLTSKQIEYLSTRGISIDTANLCKVANNGGAIAFNYYKEDEIVGAKYRKTDSKFFWQHAGCKKYLYGLDDIKGMDNIVIVEGEFDKLACYEAGVEACVSVSQGAPNVGSEVGGKLSCLDNSIEYIKQAKRVVLFCDNDENGRYLTQVLVERFGADRCSVVELPENCKDANDVLLKHGKDYIVELITNAINVPISGVRTVEQVSEKLWSLFDKGFRKGVHTGVEELRENFSFYKPWWNLYYGIPNSGKSAYVLYLMMSMAINKGWKWAVFSPEHYPAEDFYFDCVKILTGRNVELNQPNRLTREHYKIALEFLHKHFFFVYPEDDKNSAGEFMSNTCEVVIDKIRELKLAKDIDGFLIDPFNQMVKASADKGKSVDVHLEEALGKIDRLCKTHNLSGNITAHPRTMYKDKDSDNYKKPTPYECAGGAMWYNKAYTISCIHRPFNQSDKNDRSVEIDVQKVKSHKRGGKPGLVNFQFNTDLEWYIGSTGSVQTSALYGKFSELCGDNEPDPDSFTAKLQEDDPDFVPF